MRKFSFLIAALAGFSFFSCKDSKSTEPEVVTVETEEHKEVYAIAPGNVEFNNEEVAEVFAQYLRLQTALINTDGKEGRLEAEKLSKQIHEGSLEANDEVRGVAQLMAESDDIDIQRKGFETISDWMLKTVEGNIASGTLYRQYCPMAFNDKGAYWISTDKKILNPYFGDKMLRCGRVETEIN